MDFLISIILPCYNMEEYIERCLKTVLNQSLKDIEVIAFNDASTDRTLDLLREYECKFNGRMVVIDSKKNIRQGGGRNAGIKVARGRYIGFVDPDDWVDETMFEKMYNKAMENDYDMVECGAYMAASTDEFYKSKPKYDYSELNGEMTDQKLERIIYEQNSLAVWNKIYKRQMILENELLFPENIYFEDVYWTAIVYFHVKKYFYIDEYLYYYFQRTDSTMHKKNSPHYFERIDLMKLKLQKLKEMGAYEKFKEAIDYEFVYRLYENVLRLMISKNDEPDYDVLNGMRDFVTKNMPDYQNNKYFQKLNDDIKIACLYLDQDVKKGYDYYKEKIDRENEVFYQLNEKLELLLRMQKEMIKNQSTTDFNR